MWKPPRLAKELSLGRARDAATELDPDAMNITPRVGSFDSFWLPVPWSTVTLGGPGGAPLRSDVAPRPKRPGRNSHRRSRRHSRVDNPHHRGSVEGQPGRTSSGLRTTVRAAVPATGTPASTASATNASCTDETPACSGIDHGNPVLEHLAKSSIDASSDQKPSGKKRPPQSCRELSCMHGTICRERRSAGHIAPLLIYRRFGPGGSVISARLRCGEVKRKSVSKLSRKEIAFFDEWRSCDAVFDYSSATTIMVASMASPVRAEHAKINLEVVDRDAKMWSAFVDQTPPDWGKNPRPVIKARVNEPIRIQYLLTNVYPHKTLENVVVHFFIARQNKVGQKELPDLKGDVVHGDGLRHGFQAREQGRPTEHGQDRRAGCLPDPGRDAQHSERSRAFRRDRPGRRRGKRTVNSAGPC